MKKVIFITIALMLLAASAFAQAVAPIYYGNTTANVTSITTATGTTLPAQIQKVRNDDSTQIAAVKADAADAKASSAIAVLNTAGERTLTDRSNFLAVTVEHVKGDSVWSTVGKHKVIDVTGMIEYWMVAYDSVALQGADSILVEIGATKLGAMAKNDWDAGEPFLTSQTSVYAISNPTQKSGPITGSGNTVVRHGFSYNEDIGYEIQTATAVNAGISRWLIWWIAYPGGTVSVVAGDGGTW